MDADVDWDTLLAALMWLQPPCYPYKLFTELREAEAWAWEMLGRKKA